MKYFPEIPDAESVHQLQVVHKACKTIQMETTFTQEQINCIEKYLHYLYGIGFFEGARSISRRKRVHVLDNEGKVIRTFESALEAAAIIGVDKSTVSQACRKGYKCCGLILVWEKQ